MGAKCLGQAVITGMDGGTVKNIGSGTNPQTGNPVTLASLNDSQAYAVVDVEIAGVRYGADGTLPVPSQGPQIPVGGTMVCVSPLAKWNFTGVQGSTGARVNVTFYKSGGAP